MNALLTSLVHIIKLASLICSLVNSLKLVSLSSESHIPGKSITLNLLLLSSSIYSSNSLYSVVVLHIPDSNNLLPIKELINIAHKYNIKILVDGAHAIGTLDLNMDLLKPDWYVGSLHKWCFTMKSVGFLYTDIINQDITKSLIVSHLYKKSYMQRFFMQGTEDQSGYLSVPVAFNFINQMGGIKSISNYNSNYNDDDRPLTGVKDKDNKDISSR